MNRGARSLPLLAALVAMAALPGGNATPVDVEPPPPPDREPVASPRGPRIRWGRYTPHQGAREKARRVARMAAGRRP